MQILAQVICTRVKPVQGLPLSYFKYKQKIPALYEKVINFSKKVYIYKNTGTGVRFQLKGSAGKNILLPTVLKCGERAYCGK